VKEQYEKKREQSRRNIRKQRVREKEQGLYGMAQPEHKEQQINQEEDLDWLMNNS
jgi:hypothetical protein